MRPDCTPLKTCTKCGVEKPATTEFFYAQTNATAPLRSVCKACAVAAGAIRARQNKDVLNRQARERRARDPEKYRAAHRESRRRNQEATEREREYHRQWCRDNAGHIRSYSSSYYAEHRQERIAASKRYAAEHPEHLKAKRRERWLREKASKAWRCDAYRAHIRNYQARKRGAPGKHTGEDREAQYRRQHGRCYWCGEKVGAKYHVDHVVPLARGGTNWPSNLVIACPRCNREKGAKMPHEFGDRLC